MSEDVKWDDDNVDPVADLIALKREMLDPNQFKKCLEERIKFIKFAYKQFFIAYFRLNPNTTLDECCRMSLIDLKDPLVVESVEELIDSGRLKISKD